MVLDAMEKQGKTLQGKGNPNYFLTKINLDYGKTDQLFSYLMKNIFTILLGFHK